MQPLQSVPSDVAAALQRGDKIEAIKLLRDATGVGLKEAKEAIDRLEAGDALKIPARAQPAVLSEEVMASIRRGNKMEAITRFRDQAGVGLKEAKDVIEAASLDAGAPGTGLAPGEVERSSSRVAWGIAVVLVGALVAYLLFKPG